ncbi:winged helix-turn-helix transcriptional regulator [Micromonospora sp. ALFpr18c]|uniref:MarR family winged helix-turn-helix transcriptional regulator n=1 Tax=unclassified Micromonospora TaxID=2617518 RepID=UPI00124BA081|nr:MarR family winged helix-turn-helix transcriptional regulator [Micromonospora sp. ALFpr18c]KAB1927979.1 winged helix-turn-helix transcriptional regulator [Micromonospora sp. ALFpr18c]
MSDVPDLMFLMSWATHALAQEHAVALSGLGISTRAYCVLERGLTGELTQSQLGELCGIDKTTMVVTLDELERAGLAERRMSETDRRARIVRVTLKGEQMVAEAGEIVARLQAEILSTVPARDRKVFLDVLGRLINGRLSTIVQAERSVRRRAAKAA